MQKFSNLGLTRLVVNFKKENSFRFSAPEEENRFGLEFQVKTFFKFSGSPFLYSNGLALDFIDLYLNFLDNNRRFGQNLF